MDVVRLVVEAFLVEAARSLLRPTRTNAIENGAAPPYDAHRLATRPLPSRLPIFPHPRAISAEAASRITGGAIR